MKKGIKNIIYVVLTVLVAGVTFSVYQNNTPLTVDLPSLSLEQLQAKEEAVKENTQISAARSRHKKWTACEEDEDCIIIDQDPCGCLIGPKGVTAINVDFMQAYEDKHQNQTTACPEGEPSQEAQCSPDAHPVCKNKVCTIMF
jgi:hypothetical protein